MNNRNRNASVLSLVDNIKNIVNNNMNCFTNYNDYLKNLRADSYSKVGNFLIHKKIFKKKVR